MMKTLAFTLGTLVLTSSGCGSDENVSKGTVNMAQAKSTVTAAAGMKGAADSKDGAKMASAAISLNGASANLVTPSAGKALTVEDPVQVAAAEMAAGSPACDDKKCVFSNYGVGGQSMNGQFEYADEADGKRVKWDLTIKAANIGGAGQGQAVAGNFDYKGAGNILVSGAKLEGTSTVTASFSGMSMGQNVKGGFETLVKYKAIVLTGGQATGGSLYAKSTSEGSSGGQSGSQSYEGTVEFK